MGPAWITVCTSWTSHYIHDSSVYRLHTPRILDTVSFSPTQIPWNVWKEQFPTVRDAKQTKTAVACCNPTPSDSTPLFLQPQ